MKRGVLAVCCLLLVVPLASAISPNPGHDFPELECDDIFCIDEPDGVGVGTQFAVTELTVFGDKGIQWSDGTITWRLGRFHDDAARATWVYFTQGSGTSYQNLAVGRLWAQTDVCIDGDCRGAWPGGSGGALGGSGTVNRIPKFTAAQTLGNSVIFDNGNVGIGTTSPERKLQVNNQIKLGPGSVATDDTRGIYWHTNSNYAIYRTPGPWISPEYQKLRINWETGIDYRTGSTASREHRFYNGGTKIMTINSNVIINSGNLGIGTSPTQKLDVNGKIRMRTVTASGDSADTVATKGYVDSSTPAESDPTVIASVKDGVSWAEVSGKPAGFADNVDNEGIASEDDPQVAAVTSGRLCRGTGSAVTCDISANSNGHVRGGLYGWCYERFNDCKSASWPASCEGWSSWDDRCSCPGGYSTRFTGSREGGGQQSTETITEFYSCMKT